MSDIDAFYIPKHLDDPERFLFWTIDEALILISPIVMGWMIDHRLFGFVAGILVWLFYRKFKSSGNASLIQYSLYWHLPRGILGLKYTPPSYIRYYVG